MKGAPLTISDLDRDIAAYVLLDSELYNSQSETDDILWDLTPLSNPCHSTGPDTLRILRRIILLTAIRIQWPLDLTDGFSDHHFGKQ